MPLFRSIWLSAILRLASSYSLRAFSQRVGELSSDEPSTIQLSVKRTEEGWYATELQLSGSTVHLLVDTGSSALWARIPRPPKSRASGSNTSLGNFSAQYGRGAISGEVVDAPLILPGATPTKPRSCRVGRPINEQGFWAQQRTIDGVLGLGCSNEGAAVDALACVVPVPPQKLLLFGPRQRRVFCLQLTPSGGTLTLGSVPQTVQINMVSMPAAEDCGHWSVPLLSLGIQDQKIAGGTGTMAILDSGSDGVIGPTFAVIELARRLGASPAKAGEGYGGEVTFYEVPCDGALSLPVLKLVLGDEKGSTIAVTLRGSDLVSPGKDGDEVCHLRIAGWETESWILGAVFLTRLQAVSFDIESGAVSIAPPQGD